MFSFSLTVLHLYSVVGDEVFVEGQARQICTWQSSEVDVEGSFFIFFLEIRISFSLLVNWLEHISCVLIEGNMLHVTGREKNCYLREPFSLICNLIICYYPFQGRGAVTNSCKHHWLVEQKLLHFVDAFHQYVMDRVRIWWNHFDGQNGQNCQGMWTIMTHTDVNVTFLTAKHGNIIEFI